MGAFHFAILPPSCVSNAGRPSRAARRFLDETTGPDPAALQDLVDALPEIVKAAAGLPLEFRLDVTLGASVKDIQTSTLESIDKLLRDVSPDLGLKR